MKQYLLQRSSAYSTSNNHSRTMLEETVLRVTPEERIAIKRSSGKSEAEIEQYEVALREWLKKQPHLPQTLDNAFLDMMLQRNKFSLEKTKSKLDTYFSVRNLIPEYFDSRSVLSDGMQFHMGNVIFTPMPKLMKNLSRLSIFRTNQSITDGFNEMDVIKFFFLACDLRLHFDLSDSETLIVDYENFTFGHMLKFPPPVIKKVMTVLVKAYSDRIKGVHIINAQSYVASSVTLIQSLLDRKLASRVHVHKTLESLHEFIDKEDLPSDYKGHQKSISEHTVEWRKYIESKADWLVKQSKLRSNEALRISGCMEDMFSSMHGSFRSLNVD